MSIWKLLPVLCLLVLMGCTSPGPMVRIRVSGGQKILVSIRDGRVLDQDVKQVRVETARLFANFQLKKATYAFGLIFNEGNSPTSIVVEDVSDEKASLMVQDDKPALDGRAWRYVSKPVEAGDESIKWIQDLDDSFRVYRFTIILKDGQKISMYHATLYPGFSKSGLRKALGGEE